MTKKHHTTSLLLMLGMMTLFQQAVSAPLSRQQAQQNVSKFLQQKGIDIDSMSLRHAPICKSQEKGNEPYYIFNVGNDNGFVIASGDDRAYAILGYSYEGSLDTDNMPDGMKWMLDFYAEQIAATPETAKRSNLKAAGSYPVVEPLLTTKWDQYAPFNNNCPLRNGKKCVTGCVATAMAQVMYYHRKRSTERVMKYIPGYDYYVNLNTFVFRVDSVPKGSFIDWDNMIDDYENTEYTDKQAQAVANLMFYCGVAVHMNYSPDGSAASYENIPDALTTFFDYKHNKLVKREDYSDTEWENMVYNDLLNGNPVLYGGGNHSYVIDGSDGNGYVHVNWGWGGYHDNYFLLSAVEGKYPLDGYSRDQNALFSTVPNDVYLRVNSLSLLSDNVVENISSLDYIPVEFDMNVTNIEEGIESFYVDTWPQIGDDTLSWFNENEKNKVTIPFNTNQTIRKKYYIPANIQPGVYTLEPYCDIYDSSTGELSDNPHRLRNFDLYHLTMVIKEDKAYFYVGRPIMGGEIVHFKDNDARSLCIYNWDYNEDNEMSTEELGYVNTLDTVFKGSNIKTFDELKYFTGLTSIEEESFCGATNLQSIIIPNNIKKIYTRAFQSTKLSSVYIPKNVKYISNGAFSQTPLQSITVSPENQWYDSRNNCNAIIKTATKELVSGCVNTIIPDGILTIGNYAFDGCTKLKSFTVPESVTSIGKYAYRATGLEEVIIPKHIKNIGTGAFSYTSIDHIEVSLDNPWYDSRYHCCAIIKTNSNTLVAGFKGTIIPDDVTTIGESAFEGIENLSHVEIPKNVTSVKSNAFRESKLTSITIWAMDDGRDYGNNIFCDCESLTSIRINQATPWNHYTTLFNNEIYEKVTLYVPFGAKEAYEEATPWKAFKNIVEDEEIVNFEDSEVKRICAENWDLNGDGELSKYELAQVEYLGNVFSDNYNYPWGRFTELDYFINLKGIGTGEFEGAYFWWISLPESITYIGDNASISGNEAYIPKRVSYIGYRAFMNFHRISVDPYNKWYDSRNDCDAVIETATNKLILGCENTVIPNDVKIIGELAFERCDFTSGTIIIPEGVTTIENDAFNESRLESITIPKSITRIGYNAFSSDFLTSVTVKRFQPLAIDESVFYGPYMRLSIYDKATLYVPRGTKAAYETAEGWKNFSKIVEYGNLAGDVNGDGAVNIADVTMMINYILGIEQGSFDITVADLNDDNTINISDVTMLVKVILCNTK